MTSLIGQKAPDFTSATVMADGTINENFNLHEYLNGSYGIVFFYPLDFTFVCPSEILAFHHRMDQFKAKNTKVVAVSVDSQFTHLAWRKTPINEGGLGNVDFPLVADLDKSIAKNYDVLLDAGVALRGTFLIDKNGVIRHYVVNDLPLGRNVDETLRMVDALDFHKNNGEVCPAGWQEGKAGMKETPEGVASYLSDHADEL